MAEPSADDGGAAVPILLVDDDVELGGLMRDFFARHDVRLDAEHDARRGLARALEGGYRLIIVHVMMPGLDGFEVLRQLRKRSQVPVIMLTARTALEDRVEGLNAGADDYLPKPFGREELLARIRAVLRRTDRAEAMKPAAFEVNGVRLNPATRQVCDRLLSGRAGAHARPVHGHPGAATRWGPFRVRERWAGRARALPGPRPIVLPRPGVPD